MPDIAAAMFIHVCETISSYSIAVLAAMLIHVFETISLRSMGIHPSLDAKETNISIGFGQGVFHIDMDLRWDLILFIALTIKKNSVAPNPQFLWFLNPRIMRKSNSMVITMSDIHGFQEPM